MTANPGTLKFLASARPIATRSPHTNGKVFIPFRSMSRLGFKLFKESQSTCYRPVVASRAASMSTFDMVRSVYLVTFILPLVKSYHP